MEEFWITLHTILITILTWIALNQVRIIRRDRELDRKRDEEFNNTIKMLDETKEILTTIKKDLENRSK